MTSDVHAPPSTGPATAEPVPDVAEIRFPAMGTSCHVIVVDGPAGTAEAAAAHVASLEAAWSRFREDSEIAELNRRAGEWVRVSPPTRELVVRGVDAWRATGGRFDPTILGDLVRAGYDRSYEQLGDRTTSPAAPPGADLGLGCGAIELADDAVRLPAGSGFDPGGIGKGLAADMVAAAIARTGAAGACVNLGGDARVWGRPPSGPAWGIAVDHERSDRPIAQLGLAAGAVATSTTLRRRWLHDGRPHHHVIDPRTGQPAESDLDTVTVVAGSGWSAEALASAALVAGSELAPTLVGDVGGALLAVTVDGRVLSTPALGPFLTGPLPNRLPARFTEVRT
jgi:thiamine biosynthesis lipoprotein